MSEKTLKVIAEYEAIGDRDKYPHWSLDHVVQRRRKRLDKLGFELGSRIFNYSFTPGFRCIEFYVCNPRTKRDYWSLEIYQSIANGEIKPMKNPKSKLKLKKGPIKKWQACMLVHNSISEFVAPFSYMSPEKLNQRLWSNKPHVIKKVKKWAGSDGSAFLSSDVTQDYSWGFITPCGSVLAWCTLDTNISVPREEGRTTIKIEYFEVIPPYNNRGVGRKAFCELASTLKSMGFKQITLITSYGSRGFWRKQGFERYESLDLKHHRYLDL